LLFFVQTPKIADGAMQVAVFDVGQGLAVVIKTANHTLLYDAGPKFSAQSDAGSRIVVPYLRGEGIKKLDGFIVGHNDIDHSGGAASVLAQMPVGWLASSYDLAEISTTQKHMKCFAGQHWRWDSVQFTVLHPTIENYDDPEIKDNNRSCVVKVTSQYGSILLTGDIEKDAELALLGANKVELAGDVLIAPHHGSKTSSTVDFVQAVNAKQTIFTVGYLNRFKHPKPKIVERYQANDSEVFRSDNAGAVSLNFAVQGIQTQQWRYTHRKYWQDLD
jgi:competence protein ComEC